MMPPPWQRERRPREITGLISRTLALKVAPAPWLDSPSCTILASAMAAPSGARSLKSSSAGLIDATRAACGAQPGAPRRGVGSGVLGEESRGVAEQRCREYESHEGRPRPGAPRLFGTCRKLEVGESDSKDFGQRTNDDAAGTASSAKPKSSPR